MFDPLTLKGEYYNEELFSLLRNNRYKQIDTNTWLSPEKVTYIFSLSTCVEDHFYANGVGPKFYIIRITMYDSDNNLIKEDYSHSLPKINRAIRDWEERAKKDKNIDYMLRLYKLIVKDFDSFAELKEELEQFRNENLYLLNGGLEYYGANCDEILAFQEYVDMMDSQEFTNPDGTKSHRTVLWNKEKNEYEIITWSITRIIGLLKG